MTQTNGICLAKNFKAWRGQRVLVTGGTGFLASHLCLRLLEAGADVHATSRQDHVSGLNSPRWWKTDLSSAEEVRSLLAAIQPSVVYHLAGFVGAKPDLSLVLPTFESLLASTIHILMGATEFGCQRIVLSGSLTEPGPPALYPIPSSPYATAKWAASAYGRMFHALYHAPVVIAVPFMTFGPRQGPEKLVPSVILNLLRGEVPRLSSGVWEADWIYVEDVVQGFIKAGIVPGIEGATLELGAGAKLTTREIVEKIAALMETSIRPVFGAIPDRPREPVRIADTLETRRVLGWAPTTSLAEGLRQTIQWYAKQMSVGSLR
ncbi:MAG: NAD-dependent epimerase/dehydratase family protein [Nitrospira sp.]|nr:NAD-dependent epimerase/dehydratase family protein [Nitrospira sp.]